MSSAEENLSDNEGYKRRRVSRACDSCRKKKIRCDGIQGPGKKCSHCTAFKLNCSYVQTAQRRPPPKSYVAGLEDRLRNMEELLQQMTASGSGPIFTPVSGERVGSSAGSSVGESPQSTSGHRDSPPLGALRARFSPGSLEEAQPSDDEDELIINKINGNFRQLTMQDRFFGKSSGVTLVKTALEYKRGMSVSGPGSKWVIPNGRAEFWVPQTWQSDPESFEWAWPDPDLQQDLIDIFFERQNVTLPLLHRPTFEKLLGQGLHTRSVSFATVVMGVFACASRHSEDTRVLLDGSSSWHSAGWKFYNQIRTDRHLVQCNPSLYDIQAYCLRSLFLQGNSTPQAAWITLSMGLRLAQDLGAHRRIAYGQRPTVEGELLKRAFWILVLLDRLMSAGIGRSCGIYEEDFDLDLPIDCDDEYWSDGFQQPLDKPSLVAAFISSLKLSKVLGFALRSLYSINKSKLFLGLVGADWEQHVAAELDSMLNEWIDSVPSHLRWDPVRPLSKFFVQSANIYSFYYFTQIMVHRPFVTKKGASPALTFPSMAICTNAARSSARLAEVLIRRHYHRVFPGVLQLCGFTSAIILLLNLWQAKRFGISVDADKEMALIRVWMDYAKSLEDRTIMGGRFWDVLNELTNFGDLPTSHFSNSRSTSKRPNSDLDEPSPFQQPLPSQTSTVLTPATNLTVPSRPSSHLSTSVAPSPQFQSTDTGLHTAGASGSDTFGLDSWDTARSSLAGGIGHTAIHASPGLSTLGSGAALGGYHPAAYPLNSTAATPESAALGQNPSISDVNSQASQTFDESFPTEDSQAGASEQWPNFLDMVPGTFTHDNNIMSMGMGMMSSLPSNNSAEDWNAYFSTMFNTSNAPTPDWTGHPSSDSTSHG